MTLKHIQASINVCQNVNCGLHRHEFMVYLELWSVDYNWNSNRRQKEMINESELRLRDKVISPLAALLARETFLQYTVILPTPVNHSYLLNIFLSCVLVSKTIANGGINITYLCVCCSTSHPPKYLLRCNYISLNWTDFINSKLINVL